MSFAGEFAFFDDFCSMFNISWGLDGDTTGGGGYLMKYDTFSSFSAFRMYKGTLGGTGGVGGIDTEGVGGIDTGGVGWVDVYGHF